MLDPHLIRRTLELAAAHGADLAELFVEDVRSSSASLDDGRVEDLVSGRDRGAGIRVIVGERTGFAHTADLSPEGLAETARVAAASARGSASGGRRVALDPPARAYAAPVRTDPGTVGKADKVELLRRADEAARAGRAEVSQVAARYGDVRRRVLVANTDGVFVTDDLTKTSFSVSVVAKGDAGLQTGRHSVGRVAGFELFDVAAGGYDVEELARMAAARAIRKLDARPAPSGALPVVIAGGSGGVLFHEACGHGLEADLVDKGASVFAGRRGEQVASSLVTLVDDGTLVGEWGYFGIDDEGNPARRNVLIERGVLTDYLYDSQQARKAGRPGSGHGRRQSYRHLPMVRMTNTYITGGDSDPADIIASTDYGVYVAQLGGGQVNTASGDFVFGMTEAYLIEGGVITAALRDGNLIGNGPAALAAIDAVGTDFSMGYPGTCGKDGQGVPVGMGTPTLRVPSLTVGGTAA